MQNTTGTGKAAGWKLLVLIFGGFLTPLASIAQHAGLDSLLIKFDRYRTASASEKLYVHLDKTVCIVGENIWFSISQVNDATHMPGGISSVAYAELIDASHHAMVQAKVGLKDGHGSGAIFIPASLPSGRYTFRAYTRWMQNFSAEAYFSADVTVINPFRNADESSPAPQAKDSLYLYPEGGNLIYGIPSRVAFRYAGRYGTRDLPSAYLINNNKDTLATLRADTLGLGSFRFTPTRGNSYFIKLAPDKRFVTTVALPPVLETGYTLSTTDSTGDRLILHVRTAGVDPTSSVFVVAHARNIISLAEIHRLSNGTLTVALDRKKMPEGITHITLFDKELRPVCERLCFVPVATTLTLKVKPSQAQYGLRRKVSLDVSALAQDQRPAASTLSMAVFRRDSLDGNANPNIVSYLWLNSELRDAPILSPDFISSSDKAKQAVVDNIMMTNGWRKFRWKSINQGPLITFAPEPHGHIITGKVKREGTPTPQVNAYLSSPGLNIQMYGCFSDERGDVEFEMKDFYGPRKIVVQTNLKTDSLSAVEIANPFSDRYSARFQRPFTLNPAYVATLTDRTVGMQVQDIFVRDRGTQSRGALLDTTAFYGKANETYYLDDFTRFPVMEEILREYVPGVLVRKHKDGFHLYNFDVVSRFTLSEDAFVMLDGVPIFNTNKLMAYDPLRIRKLEVFNRRYYKGELSLPGVISFTTYAGDLGGYQLDPKCVVLDYEGLQLQREFYAPKYETSKQRESRIPDQRFLLFWAPGLSTDAQGNVKVDFFTSDLTGNFDVVIEGLTGSGAAGTGFSSFVVWSSEN